YGRAIAASLAKAPDQQQLWYAFCLKNVREGWTLEQRKGYFRWFDRARQWAGGASFQGFLQNIENESFLGASEAERLLIEASGARKPFALPEIPKPSGPGKEWTLDEVRDMAEGGLINRDFENGRRMYAATRCVICHRFDGSGGATGPDLTQIAGRFNLKDLTEAIMDPSRVISDQYRASTIVTSAGQTISGRVVSETDAGLTVLVNPEDPASIRDIAHDDIDEVIPSAVSIMPAKLLDPLNRDELLDLLAYLLSRGDSRNQMFRK
ncbi:MAG: c-type cytochrome, partial [Planctomycetaceae bacterium]